jgi:hypothetical protein
MDRGKCIIRVGPHRFRPLGLRDTVSGGRCRDCLLPREAHPVRCFVVARPLGDKSRGVISWETLHG